MDDQPIDEARRAIAIGRNVPRRGNRMSRSIARATLRAAVDFRKNERAFEFGP